MQHILPVLKRIAFAAILAVVLVSIFHAFTDRPLFPLTFANKKVEATITRSGIWPLFDYSFDASSDRFVFGPRGGLLGPNRSEAFERAQSGRVQIYVPTSGEDLDTYGTYAHPFIAFIYGLAWPATKLFLVVLALVIALYWWTDIRQA